MERKLSFEPAVLNLGGGFGIRYTREDDPKPASDYVEEIIQEVKEASRQTFHEHSRNRN